MRKKKLVLLVILLVIIALIIGGVSAIFGTLGKIRHFEDREETYTTVSAEEVGFVSGDAVSGDALDLSGINTEVMKNDNVVNILLIGEDQRTYAENQEEKVSTSVVRSDTMILCSINKQTNQISLISFMRDLYVPIPGYGNNRLNAAFAVGGPTLLTQTIEEDFGVSIDGVVAVNLEGFLGAMDVVGDVDLYLTAAEAEYINEHAFWGYENDKWGSEEWTLTEGWNTLTPNQSLAYARVRKFGNSDWDRTTRQRQLLYAVFKKIASSNPVAQLRMANELLPNFTTDFSTSTLLGYAYTVLSGGMEMTGSYRVPVDGGYTSQRINGMSVLVPNLEQNRLALQDYIYGELTESQEAELSGELEESKREQRRKLNQEREGELLEQLQELIEEREENRDEQAD